MHDDTVLTRDRAHRVLTERILPAVHGERAPVEVTAYALPGEPIPVADALAAARDSTPAPAAAPATDDAESPTPYLPHEVGSPWGPAWGTTWFHITGRIPRQWAGRRVELLADLGFDPSRTGFQAEALVYRPDGSPVKALNPRNQHVTLTREAGPGATGGEQVDLFLEAASNPLILGDDHAFLPTREGDVRTSSPRPLYETRTIELAVFEPEVFELAMDVSVLLELQAELPPGTRRARILQGLDDALDVLDLQDVAGTAASSRAVLAPLLAARAGESEHRISAIGHSHIDSAWLWPVRETIRKVARTASSMTALIEDSDDFRYGMSSAQQYAWIKEHRPEVYARVKEAVAAGRFLPLGGMWVESDTVMPSGESLVRQLVYGQRFFEQEFGIRCAGVWLPDSFGYSPALPQLIKRAGFEWFFTQKISWNQVNVFPHHTFWWEGIDGSRVFTHFPPMDTYNAELTGAELAKATRQFRESRVATGSIAPVGYGDGGGGTTREMLARAERLRDLEGSARVTWEHPGDFYRRAMAELPNPPVWVGELYLELHRATLTSQHRTKRGNRRCEWLLVEAERWSAQAALEADLAYPHEELEALWRQVLLQQFHDILPGTSIAWVHREAAAQYARVEAAATAVIERALAALTGAGEREIRVNPAAFARGGVAAGGSAAGGDVVVDHSAASVTHDDDGGFLLSNSLVQVRVSAAGTITSARDLATGREVIAPGAEGNVFQLHQDFPNKWDAWDVDRHYRAMMTELCEPATLTAALEGDRVVLTLERAFSQSVLTQRITLEPGSRTLLFETDVDWHESEKFLKVAFPLDVRADYTLAETQFGYQRRVTHTNTSWEAAKFETSMHRYVLAMEESAPGDVIGAALVNDSLYGYDVAREVSGTQVTTTLRLSLLRSPRFPDPETDQGQQLLTYGLVIGADVAAATSAGALLSSPERVVRGEHAFAPLTAATDGIVVSSVALAGDRSGDLVVRVYESLGRRTRGSLTVRGEYADVIEVDLLEAPLAATAPAEVTRGEGEVSVALTLGPFEVRTLRLPRATPVEWAVTPPN